MQHGAGMMTSPPQAQPQQQHPAQSMMATTQMSMTFPAPPQMQQPQQMHPITLQNTQPVKYPGAHQVFQPQEVPQTCQAPMHVVSPMNQPPHLDQFNQIKPDGVSPQFATQQTFSPSNQQTYSNPPPQAFSPSQHQTFPAHSFQTEQRPGPGAVPPTFSSNLFDPNMYPTMNMSVHQQRYSEPQKQETIVFGPKLIPKTPLEANEQFSYENGSHSSNSNTDTSLKQMLPINNAENVIIASNKKQIRALQTQVMHLMKELHQSNNMMAKLKMELVSSTSFSMKKHRGENRDIAKLQEQVKQLKASEAKWREKAENLGSERQKIVKQKHDLEKRLLDSRLALEDARSEVKMQRKHSRSTSPARDGPGKSRKSRKKGSFQPPRAPKQIICLYEPDQNYYPAVLLKKNDDGTAKVMFSDYGDEEYTVPQNYIREHKYNPLQMEKKRLQRNALLERKRQALEKKREIDLAWDRARIERRRSLELLEQEIENKLGEKGKGL